MLFGDPVCVASLTAQRSRVCCSKIFCQKNKTAGRRQNPADSERSVIFVSRAGRGNDVGAQARKGRGPGCGGGTR